jgi:hypothetical protein
MEEYFDRLHANARQFTALHRLAIISRILLASAFIPTGAVKLLGRRFTLLGTDNPIGAFFEALYQTGFYWNFLGLGQVLAGVALIIPATRTLGAVMFLPILLNVVVLTWSLNFTGTVYITTMMLVANVFLLCWDYDRLKRILFRGGAEVAAPTPAPMPAIEKAGYAVGGTAALVVLLAIRSLAPMTLVKWMLLAGVMGIVMVLVGWVQVWIRERKS